MTCFITGCQHDKLYVNIVIEAATISMSTSRHDYFDNVDILDIVNEMDLLSLHPTNLHYIDTWVDPALVLVGLGLPQILAKIISTSMV